MAVSFGALWRGLAGGDLQGRGVPPGSSSVSVELEALSLIRFILLSL